MTFCLSGADLSLELVRLKEFKRLVENSPTLSLAAKEHSDGQYIVLAIDTANQRAYSVRHAREPMVRTWRLDRLMATLKAAGVTICEVRNLDTGL